MEEDQACTYRDNSIDHRSQHREWSYATQAISSQERWSRSSNHWMHNQRHHLRSHHPWHWIRLQHNVKISIRWVIWFNFIPNMYLVADGGSITKVPRRTSQGCHGKNSRTIYTCRFSSSWHPGRRWFLSTKAGRQSTLGYTHGSSLSVDGAQTMNSMVTQDTGKLFIQVRPPSWRNTYVLRLIVLICVETIWCPRGVPCLSLYSPEGRVTDLETNPCRLQLP